MLPGGTYCLVCVAVSVILSPFNVQKVEGVNISRHITNDISIDIISDTISRASTNFEGVVITERGEFYNYPEWRVEAILGRKFKYAESIGERKAIDIAHHISLAAHRMLQEM